MDTASTLLGVGLLILFIAPVGYLLYSQFFQEKKRAKKLKFLAHQKGYTLDETENINGLSLGLDKASRKFILLKSGSEAKLQVMDLNNVTGIDLVKTDADGAETGILDEIREVYLQVTALNAPTKKIIYYAEEEEDPVTQKEGRLDNAVKWQKILQEIIK